jgi:hypothetical protein
MARQADQYTAVEASSLLARFEVQSGDAWCWGNVWCKPCAMLHCQLYKDESASDACRRLASNGRAGIQQSATCALGYTDDDARRHGLALGPDGKPAIAGPTVCRSQRRRLVFRVPVGTWTCVGSGECGTRQESIIVPYIA